jgi:hypothetical protein
MTANPSVLPVANSRAEFITLVESDLREVARFIAVESSRASNTVESHFRWFWLQNPARQPQQPMGFGLLSSGQLVGCILCSPQMFRFRNKQILLMGSSSFYVDEAYRGSGGRIFLSYCRLGNKWPLFGTSANAEAAALWKAAGAKPIPFSEGELFGVIRWPPVAEEVAHRWRPNKFLSRLAGNSMANALSLLRPLRLERDKYGTLEPLSSAEQVIDLEIKDFSTRFTAERDSAYLHWRYFSGNDPTTTVFAFRSRLVDKPVMVAVNQRSRGYRAQINTLNVLDVYPEVSPDALVGIVAALIARYEKKVDAIVLRSQDAERQRIFRRSGLHARLFDAPNAWYLDKSNLLPSHDWYPVPADGDGLI